MEMYSANFKLTTIFSNKCKRISTDSMRLTFGRDAVIFPTSQLRLSKTMKKIAFLCLLLFLTSCNSGTPPTPEVSPGLTQDQLVPTLQQIARSGEYSDVLQDLTVGLENTGHMNEAVTVQSFQELSSPEEVRKLAAEIAQSIQKQSTQK